ncbi:hypothetical protein JYU19_00235 [bacterium AH-315-J21]|nr:hypothetical protein [bacterium AH-315-J21]
MITLGSCSLSNERVAIFSGQIVSSDSTNSTVIPFDLAETIGYVIYDKQIDGLYDDTAIFYGNEIGEFNGVLQYAFPVNINASRLRKHVRLLIPKLEVDTFLFVDVYSESSDASDEANQWYIPILKNNSLRSRN